MRLWPGIRRVERAGAIGGGLLAWPRRGAAARLTAALALAGAAACSSSSVKHGPPRESEAPSQPAQTSLLDHANGDQADTDGDGDEAATTPGRRAAWTCTPRPFASSLVLPEASGAIYLAHADPPVLLVVGDSGTNGAFVEIDPATGAELAGGWLPLGRGASDDLEGLTAIGDTIYGITSAGWMRHWRRHPERPAARRYELVRGPYPVAASPEDEDGDEDGDEDEDEDDDDDDGDEGLVCDSAKDTNCGRNYEGLCLRDPPDRAAACAGFAVSKEDGALYCLTIETDGAADGRVRAHRRDPIDVGPEDTLTGCDFLPAAGRTPDTEVVWVGSNAFGANRVFTVTGWQRPARARVEDVGPFGVGFGEAMALGPGGALYRFSDTANAISLAAKYHCE